MKVTRVQRRGNKVIVTRRPVCHIRRAWPEFGRVPGLCGAWGHDFGGMATATCVKCLRAALYAGHLNDLDVTVHRQITRRLKRLGVL